MYKAVISRISILRPAEKKNAKKFIPVLSIIQKIGDQIILKI